MRDTVDFLIVDDHALFRSGLAMLLAQAWPGATIMQAASLHDGLQLARDHQPRLILLDVRLPDGAALAHPQAWVAAAADAVVMLMSSEVDGEVLAQAREAGLAGFLHKAAAAQDVLASVREALARRPAYGTVPYAVLQAADDGPPATVQAHDAALSGPTALQAQIIPFLGRGTPNKAIARQLGLSENQVRVEVSWLTEALGADSREEAYRQALQRGWLQP